MLLAMEKKIDIKDCIAFGWNTFKARALYFVGVYALFMIIMGVFSFPDMVDGKEYSEPFLYLLSLVSFIVSVLGDMFMRKFSLLVHDDVHTASLRNSWTPGSIVSYVGATILVALGVICGLVLLIVPGIIFALALMFTSFVVLEKKCGPIEAMQESIRLTKGNRMALLGLMLALFGINILGALALLVGLLVSVPVSMFAVAHAYRVLSCEQSSTLLAPETVAAS